ANQRNALKLLKLINDLLDLAKLEEGFIRLRPESTDLLALMTEVIEFARPLAARKTLTLELVIRRKPDGLMVDIEKIERVLVNLIANALKFTKEGGVTVVMDVVGDDAQIAVEDTGVGIAADQLE